MLAPASLSPRMVPPPPARHAQRERVVMLGLAIGIVWAGALATQYVAARAGDSAFLGRAVVHLAPRLMRALRWAAWLSAGGGVAILTRPAARWITPLVAACTISAYVAGSGPLYAPYQIFLWYAAYRQHPDFVHVYGVAWSILGGGAVLAAACVLTVARRWRMRHTSVAHGSAAWGGGEELRGTDGLLLGRDAEGAVLRYRGEGHLLTIAPTRSGKGTGCVIPNLLSYPGSIVVTDVKGELYAVTHRHRAQAFGQRLYALDPFDMVAAGTASFNPLDLVESAKDTAIDNARLIADMLIVADRRGGDAAFWDEEARSLLVGLILYVAAWADHGPIRERRRWDTPPDAADGEAAGLPGAEPEVTQPPLRTLIGVREVLTAGPAEFQRHLERMALWREWCHGLVARAADRLLQKADRERSGVVSCAQNHTHFLDSPRMVTVLGASTVPLEALKRQGMSVYLILPYEHLDGYARWLRLMIACGLIAVARDRHRPAHRVLFLIDEFDALGPLRVVQRGIALTGGSGVAFWLFLQDVAQLKGTYPDRWGTFLANADVLQCFGTNDLETAEYLSRLVGDTTIAVTSENQSTGVSRGRSAARQEGRAVTVSETARRLILPDEVRRLPRERQLLFVKDSPPILARRLDYLRDEEFIGQADPNPLYLPLAPIVGAGAA